MSEGVLGLFSLRGKGALVTGAGRGLGRAMALALAEAGADVAAVDVEPLDGVGSATRELDLRALTPDAAADLVAWARSELGDLSVLVNNAGMIRRAPAAETTAEDWHEVIAPEPDGAVLPRPRRSRSPCSAREGAGASSTSSR